MMVGPTSEFSLFFRIKPGKAQDLRAALQKLQETPGYRPGDYNMAIQTIHDARFVLFDDDTQLAFVTSFDGPWDAYMEDFFTSGRPTRSIRTLRRPRVSVSATTPMIGPVPRRAVSTSTTRLSTFLPSR